LNLGWDPGSTCPIGIFPHGHELESVIPWQGWKDSDPRNISEIPSNFIMVDIHLTNLRSFVPISAEPISIKVFKRKRVKQNVQNVDVVLMVAKPGTLDSGKSIDGG
jgi:hypothetical protein